MHAKLKIERLTSIANFPFLTGLDSTKTVTWSATDSLHKSARFDFRYNESVSQLADLILEHEHLERIFALFKGMTTHNGKNESKCTY